jgi:hypothetical protein
MLAAAWTLAAVCSVPQVWTGLPDGLFSKKSQFGEILEGLGMEIVGIFYV